MNIKISFSHLRFSMLLLLLVTISYANAQELMWAKWIGKRGGTDGIGNKSINNSNGIALDPLGNFYMTGYFLGSINFDAGTGFDIKQASPGGFKDIFITKYDANGNYLWTKQIGATGINEVAYAIVVDSNSNIYITGIFSGTVDFDPGPGIATLASVGSAIFIAKYDADGNYIWAKGMGSQIPNNSNEINSFDLGLDGNNNIYITGNYYGTIDFDPGGGIANLTSSKSNRHIFLARYDNNGNYLWAKDMVGTGEKQNPESNSLVVDFVGNVYITGSFQGTVDFDPGVAVANLTARNSPSGGNSGDIFIAGYDNTGQYKWAKRMGGAAADDHGYGITLDRSGSLFITGKFSDTVDFDPGAAVANLTTNGVYYAFVGKYDANGNYLWAQKLGGNSMDHNCGLDIATDAAGNVVVTGYFSDTANFASGSGIPSLISRGWTDIFIAQYNSSGSPVWAKGMGGEYPDYGKALCLNFKGDTYLTGSFTDSVDFDFGPGLNYLYNGNRNNKDIFFLKIGKCTNQNYATKVTACDNYTIQNRNYTASGVYTHTFTSVTGCDSNVVLTLTIKNRSTNRVITGKYCDSFTFNKSTYHTSGVYTQYYSNAFGCDSNITLDLTINTAAAKVIRSGTALIAAQNAETYQWFNCDRQTIIPGATDKVYTTTAKGSYAVIITMGACTDTSECVIVEHPTGINEYLAASNFIKVYPNPTDKDLFLETIEPLKHADIRIVNSIGQTVLTQFNLTGHQFRIDLSALPQGVYYVELKEKDKVGRQMIIKL